MADVHSPPATLEEGRAALVTAGAQFARIVGDLGESSPEHVPMHVAYGEAHFRVAFAEFCVLWVEKYAEAAKANAKAVERLLRWQTRAAIVYTILTLGLLVAAVVAWVYR